MFDKCGYIKSYSQPYFGNMIHLTDKEIIDALERSGYLLESEMTKLLAQSGFFVESNQIIEDPITGKGREIDLIAELYNYNEESSKFKTASRIIYIFEIKNNILPVVLLTKFEFSPNIVLSESLKEISTVPKKINHDSYEGFYKRIFNGDKDLIFTQYCSFNKKKANEELMALHPDNIHDGLLKIVHYCEKQVDSWGGEDSEIDDLQFLSDYYRHFLYLPILLLNDDLYELGIDEENNRNLKKVDCSKLLYNYYYKGEPKMSLVYFVTKKGFPDLMKKLIDIEKEVLESMIERKKGSS